MSAWSSRTLALVAGLVALGCTASSASAQAPLLETQIAQEKDNTLVAAYGGWVVWSRYDEAQNMWRLVGREPGSASVRRLPVAARAFPFDVDLGPDVSGDPAAVYSRCRHEYMMIGPFSGAYRRSRGCRIVKLDLTTGRESSLYRRRGASLYLPTLWRGRLAYVVRGGRYDALHLELRVQHHRRTTTTKLGAAPAPRTEIPEAGPTRLDLYGKTLVFAWESTRARYRCPGNLTPEDDGLVTRVFLQRNRQHRELLDKGCVDSADPGAVAIANAPTISEGFVTWYRFIRTPNPADSGHRLQRRSLRTAKTISVPLVAAYVSLTADGRTIYAEASPYRIITAQL